MQMSFPCVDKASKTKKPHQPENGKQVWPPNPMLKNDNIKLSWTAHIKHCSLVSVSPCTVELKKACGIHCGEELQVFVKRVKAEHPGGHGHDHIGQTGHVR